jgi:hypothetical protein
VIAHYAQYVEVRGDVESVFYDYMPAKDRDRYVLGYLRNVAGDGKRRTVKSIPWIDGSDEPTSQHFCAIKKAIWGAAEHLRTDSLGLIDLKHMFLLLCPDDAIKMVLSREVHSYMKGDLFDIQSLKNKEPGHNIEWGLPNIFYGVNVVVETEKDYDGSWMLKPGTALMVVRVGPAQLGPEFWGVPTLSTIRLYHKGPREMDGRNNCRASIERSMVVRIDGVS